MANIKSQIKRNRQNERARERNKGVRSALKTKARRVGEAEDTATGQERLRDLTRSLDKAASKGVIHKRRAANRKSRAAKALNRQTSQAS
jgi:small subunit ribosomal protein S20